MFKVIAQEGSVKIGQKGYHKQKLWFFLYNEDGKPEPYPTAFDKVLGPEEKPYPAGEYAVAPQSFQAVTNEKGNRTLALSRLKLSPLKG